MYKLRNTFLKLLIFIILGAILLKIKYELQIKLIERSILILICFKIMKYTIISDALFEYIELHLHTNEQIVLA